VSQEPEAGFDASWLRAK